MSSHGVLFLQIHGSGALIISSLLDFMTFALCAPYSETTQGDYFDTFLEMIADQGRPLFKLFQVKCVLIQKENQLSHSRN